MHPNIGIVSAGSGHNYLRTIRRNASGIIVRVKGCTQRAELSPAAVEPGQLRVLGHSPTVNEHAARCGEESECTSVSKPLGHHLRYACQVEKRRVVLLSPKGRLALKKDNALAIV